MLEKHIAALLCNTMPELAGLSLQDHAAHLVELTASIQASLPMLRSDHAPSRRSSAPVSGPDAYLTRGRDVAAAAQTAGCSKMLRFCGMWSQELKTKADMGIGR